MKSNFKWLMLITMFFSTVVHAEVGVNNFTFNVGGSFNYSQWMPNIGTSQEKKDAREGQIGGGFSIDLGHLYLSQGSVINGWDTRFSYGMSFDHIYKVGNSVVDLPDDIKNRFYSLTVSFGTTYIVGTKMDSGRLLVDILGLNIGYFSGAEELETSANTTVFKKGENFLLGLTLPLGIQYIFDNGLILGYRHRLDFAFGESPTRGAAVADGNKVTFPVDKGGIFGTKDSQKSFLAYNLTFTIGYAIGK